MDNAQFLIVPLLQAFTWFDDGLQAYLKAKGWPNATRAQSMVMVHVITGISRPTDIARMMGVSRQAIHTTINQMVALDLIGVRDDPADGRSKHVFITANGLKMRQAAQAAMVDLTAILEARIGTASVDALRQAFVADWGDPPRSFD
jgi:DNA-binding MarR family transcriptional regulator